MLVFLMTPTSVLFFFSTSVTLSLCMASTTLCTEITMNILNSCKLTSLLRAQCICKFLVYYRHVTLDMLKIELTVQPNFHSNPPPNTSPPTEFSLLNKAVTIHTFSAVNSFETVQTFSPFFPPTPHLIDDISISILLQIYLLNVSLPSPLLLT